VKPELKGIDLCCRRTYWTCAHMGDHGPRIPMAPRSPLGPFVSGLRAPSCVKANNVLLRPSGVWLGFGGRVLADPGRMRTGCDALASGGEGVVRSAVVHPGETGLGLCSKARPTEIKRCLSRERTERSVPGLGLVDQWMRLQELVRRRDVAAYHEVECDRPSRWPSGTSFSRRVKPPVFGSRSSASLLRRDPPDAPPISPTSYGEVWHVTNLAARREVRACM